jgi:hypothetical protein
MKQAFDREVAAAECDVPALDGTQTGRSIFLRNLGDERCRRCDAKRSDAIAAREAIRLQHQPSTAHRSETVHSLISLDLLS